MLNSLDFRHWNEALIARPREHATLANIEAWVKGPLHRFLPFEHFSVIYGEIASDRIRVRVNLEIGHGQQRRHRHAMPFDRQTQNAFSAWLAEAKPILLVANHLPPAASPIRAEAVVRSSANLAAAHGVFDPFAKTASYIQVTGVPDGETALAALDLIAPVMHALILASQRSAGIPAQMDGLTERQRELVQLARAGLSDKGIANRLAISEHTVGNHFRAIYAKLGVNKRSQLLSVLG